MQPLVSVIIPTYNRRHVLGEAIESVRHQTFDDLELIVVDDGSTDGTAEAIAARFGHDSRITVHRQSNRGVAAARNAGLERARGSLIAFLDSDDAWKPWHLQLQVAALGLRPDIGLVWSDADAVGPDGTVLAQRYLRTMLTAYRYFTRDELFRESVPLAALGVPELPEAGDRALWVGDLYAPMVMGNLMLTSTVVMRRERIDQTGRFDEELVTGEDYAYFLRASREGPVGFVDVADVRYRTGTADRLSGASMNLPLALGYLAVLERTLERDRDRIDLSADLIHQARRYAHGWIGESALQAGQGRLARRHLAKAFALGGRRAWTAALIVVTLAPRQIVERLIRLRRRRAGQIAPRESAA